MPRCKNCSREINFIRSATTERLMPVDPLPVAPSVSAVLVFPDGVVAKRNPKFAVGYVHHHATCTGIKRRPKRKGAHEPPLLDVSGCPHNCASGWISTERGAKPCPVHNPALARA